MTGIILTNSEWTYGTQSEMDDYFVGRGIDPFAADSVAAIDGYLTIARDYMDGTFEWEGVITSTSQDGAWPRTGVVDREGRSIGSSTIPDKIKHAQFELAAIAKANGGRILTLDAAAEVKRVKAGSVEVEFEGGSEPGESERMQAVDRLLVGLIKTRTASSGIRSVPLVRV